MPEKRNDSYFERTFMAEIRAGQNQESEEGSILEGVAVVYDTPTIIRDCFGEFEEVIERGAISEEALDDVRFLKNHDFNSVPLARSRRNNKSDKPNTMKLEVKDDGLHIRANIDTQGNTEAKNLYSAIERGDMSGMSFCFFCKDDDEHQTWEKKEDGALKRTIHKIDTILECSAVSFPAYSTTSIGTRSQRSLDSDARAVANARKRLELDNSEKRSAVDYKTQILIQMYSKGAK